MKHIFSDTKKLLWSSDLIYKKGKQSKQKELFSLIN